MEGKTPEITIDQARTLLASIDTSHLVGLRDRAILSTLAYTACRGGAVAKLRLQDFQCEGSQYVLRFQEKGGKSREIPVRHDLEGFIRAYLDAAKIEAEAKDSPLFRAGNGRTKRLTGRGLSSKIICELVKRRLKDAGLPSRLSPHSFRVTAITDLLCPSGGRVKSDPSGARLGSWTAGIDGFSASGLVIQDVVHPLDQRRSDGRGDRAQRHLVHHVGDGHAAIRVGDHQ
jgi:site-specific recombinase XerC